jgi:hypothetical protein
MFTKVRNENTNPSFALQSEEMTDTPVETQTCVICIDAPADVKNIGCTHTIMCADCALKLLQTRVKTYCPVCRAPISGARSNSCIVSQPRQLVNLLYKLSEAHSVGRSGAWILSETEKIAAMEMVFGFAPSALSTLKKMIIELSKAFNREEPCATLMFIDVRLSELASRKIISMDNMEALLGISNLANHSR